MFAERGYERASMSDVAKHAGIGQGTVYRYFESKRELLDHVVDYGFERLLAATGLDDAQEYASSLEEFAGQIRAIAERLFAIVDEEPALLRLVLVEANAIDEELKARLLGLVDMLSGMIASYLDRGRRAGWIRADLDSHAVAHGMLMLVVPGFLLVLRGEATPEHRARYVRGLVDFTMRGIRAQGSVR